MTNQVKSIDVEYKKTELGNIPIDWTVKSIGEICEILDSKRKPLNKAQRVAMKGSIPYYGANGIVDYVNDFLFNEKLILMAEDGGNFAEYETKPIAYKIEGHSWVNNHAHVLKPKKNYILDWIYYSVVNKNIIPFISGGTRAKLNQADLKKIVIPIPPLKEQKKITEILSAADKQIEITEQIIDKTKELKKGLMQQLLTKGINHTLFNNTELGELPIGWDVMKLDDVCIKITDGTHHSPKTFKSGPYKYISAKNIKEGRLDLRNVTYVDAESHHSIYSRCNVEYNDVLYIKDGATTGIASLNSLKEPFSLLSSVALLKVNRELLNEQYLMQVLNSPLQKERMISQMSGNAITRLTLKKIKESNIPIPPLSEQNKIADILLSVDEQIRIYEKEKEKQIELKKALMQQLLTGKIRITV